ncbi:MAG TPA: hypothetical protein VLE97_01005 [Gaiellaceae bacterium]|nr:hypothetical protein [Gaiellaceae bacterium]
MTDPALDPTPETGRLRTYEEMRDQRDALLADLDATRAALAAERERREQAEAERDEAGSQVTQLAAQVYGLTARSERYRAALKEVHNRLMTWSIERFKANDHLTSGVLEELARILYDEVLTDPPESGTG